MSGAASSGGRGEGSTALARPALGQVFPTMKVKEILRAVLLEQLGENPPYDHELAKTVADAARTKLKGLELPRYKLIVQVVVGANKGEGVRVGTRCMWDAATDGMATENFTNESLFATATAYGVYLY